MTHPKRRGRRSNASVPDVARADDAMATATHRLIMWAFPSKAVFEAVSRVVSERTRAVGPERVKQIYRAWVSSPDTLAWKGRERYDKASLRSTVPATALDVGNGRSSSSWVSELARILLQNRGAWPAQEGDSIADAEFCGPAAYRLTPLAARRAVRVELTRRS